MNGGKGFDVRNKGGDGKNFNQRRDDVKLPGPKQLQGRIIRDESGNKIREVRIERFDDAIRELNAKIAVEVVPKSGHDYLLKYFDGPKKIYVIEKAHQNNDQRNVTKSVKCELSDSLQREIVVLISGTVDYFLENFANIKDSLSTPFSQRLQDNSFFNVIKTVNLKWFNDLLSMYVGFERVKYVDVVKFILLTNGFNLQNVVLGFDLVVTCSARFSPFKIFDGSVSNKSGDVNKFQVLAHENFLAVAKLRGEFRLRLHHEPPVLKSKVSRDLQVTERPPIRSDESVFTEGRYVNADATGWMNFKPFEGTGNASMTPSNMDEKSLANASTPKRVTKTLNLLTKIKLGKKDDDDNSIEDGRVMTPRSSRLDEFIFDAVAYHDFLLLFQEEFANLFYSVTEVVFSESNTSGYFTRTNCRRSGFRVLVTKIADIIGDVNIVNVLDFITKHLPNPIVDFIFEYLGVSMKNNSSALAVFMYLEFLRNIQQLTTLLSVACDKSPDAWPTAMAEFQLFRFKSDEK